MSDAICGGHESQCALMRICSSAHIESTLERRRCMMTSSATPVLGGAPAGPPRDELPVAMKSNSIVDILDIDRAPGTWPASLAANADSRSLRILRSSRAKLYHVGSHSHSASSMFADHMFLFVDLI